MPKISGVFEQFKDIDLIPIDEIVGWLKPAPNLFFLENYLGNLVFYPQIIPDSEEELNIELAILREALKRTANFYDLKKRKIIIPSEYIIRFPDLLKLVLAFTDGLKQNLVLDKKDLNDINTIVLSKKNYEINLGTIFFPKFQSTNGLIEVMFVQQPGSPPSKSYTLNQGSFANIPCQQSHCHVSFKSKDAKIQGKAENVLEIAGGEIGIIMDGRG